MRRPGISLRILMGISLLFGLAGATSAALPAEALPTLAPMIERVSPAVVNISTFTRRRNTSPLLNDPFFRHFFNLPENRPRPEARSAGSGVIVNADKGLVVSNHHVVAGADRVEVTLADGRVLPARLLGSDEQVDLALLQVAADGLSELQLADDDSLRVGDFVVAIGNPFGLGQTVTSGIVSALGRSGLGILGYEDFIQTDASINPGNSGGALVDLSGRLVGINSAIVAPAGGNVGIGFAIPADIVRQIAAQLELFGEVRRGALGITFQPISAALAEAFGLEEARGVVVLDVAPESAAADAGLRQGDVLLAIDGKPVDSAASLRNQIGLMVEGQSAEIQVLRQGRVLPLRVTLQAVAGQSVPAGTLSGLLQGVHLEPFIQENQAVALRVQRIDSNSLAGQRGLRAGDLIVTVNRTRVREIDDLRRAVAAGRSLVLQVVRGSESYFLSLP